MHRVTQESVSRNTDLNGSIGQPIPRIDLHTHSSLSDGSLTPEELVNQARAQGLTTLAITDHDTLASYEAIDRLCDHDDIHVIAGSEFSCCNPQTDKKVHILAYGLKPGASTRAIEAIAQETCEKRASNSRWQIEQIISAGYPLSREETLHLAQHSTSLYKQHIMQALTHLPYLDETYQQTYRKLFKNNGVASRDITYPNALLVVEAVKEAGGVAVLAHPGETDSYDMVKGLAQAGLDGIEKYHPSHSASDLKRIDELADKYGLIKTGGSDYHGIYGSPEEPGVFTVHPTEISEQFLELIPVK